MSWSRWCDGFRWLFYYCIDMAKENQLAIARSGDSISSSSDSSVLLCIRFRRVGLTMHYIVIVEGNMFRVLLVIISRFLSISAIASSSIRSTVAAEGESILWPELSFLTRTSLIRPSRHSTFSQQMSFAVFLVNWAFHAVQQASLYISVALNRHHFSVDCVNRGRAEKWLNLSNCCQKHKL